MTHAFLDPTYLNTYSVCRLDKQDSIIVIQEGNELVDCEGVFYHFGILISPWVSFKFS